MSSAESLKEKFEEEIEKIRKFEKDRSKCLASRRQLESQLTENNMVKEEMDKLESTANVFKLIGPVLVKQNLQEAKDNVEKRIKYIKTEICRVESALSECTKKIETQKEVTEKIRDSLKKLLSTISPS